MNNIKFRNRKIQELNFEDLYNFSFNYNNLIYITNKDIFCSRYSEFNKKDDKYYFNKSEKHLRNINKLKISIAMYSKLFIHSINNIQDIKKKDQFNKKILDIIKNILKNDDKKKLYKYLNLYNLNLVCDSIVKSDNEAEKKNKLDSTDKNILVYFRTKNRLDTLKFFRYENVDTHNISGLFDDLKIFFDTKIDSEYLRDKQLKPCVYKYLNKYKCRILKFDLKLILDFLKFFIGSYFVVEDKYYSEILHCSIILYSIYK